MAEPDLRRWLDEHALDLSTDGAPDLAPLLATLAGVRVLGVGESVVGTRELARLAHRLLEAAVAAGTRTVVLGAPEAATVVVDEVVARGEDPARALEGMADWRWSTGEVADVLSWLAGLNAARGPADRVRVLGSDPVAVAPAVKAVGRHLREDDPELVTATGESLRLLLAHRTDDAALPATVATDAARVRARLDRDGVPGTVRRYALAIGRAAELATVAVADRAATRDRLVTEAVTAATEGHDRAGGDPGVLWWGHARDVRVRLDGDVPTVGARLRERFGRGYYALGLLVGQGEFQARRRRRVRGVTRSPARHALAAAPEGSVEATVAGAGPRLLDLRGAADRDGVPDWVTAPTRMRVLTDPTPVGWQRALEAMTPAEFDGLAHVARAHEAAVR